MGRPLPPPAPSPWRPLSCFPFCTAAPSERFIPVVLLHVASFLERDALRFACVVEGVRVAFLLTAAAGMLPA